MAAVRAGHALDSERDRTLLREVHRVFNRAEELAKKVDAAELLAASDVLPLHNSLSTVRGNLSHPT